MLKFSLRTRATFFYPYGILWDITRAFANIEERPLSLSWFHFPVQTPLFATNTKWTTERQGGVPSWHTRYKFVHHPQTLDDGSSTVDNSTLKSLSLMP